MLSNCSEQCILVKSIQYDSSINLKPDPHQYRSSSSSSSREFASQALISRRTSSRSWASTAALCLQHFGSSKESNINIDIVVITIQLNFQQVTIIGACMGWNGRGFTPMDQMNRPTYPMYVPQTDLTSLALPRP